MTRTSKVLLAVVVGFGLVCMVAGITGASDEPQIVHVTLKEYQIEMSQFTVSPGKSVQFVVMNKSGIPHQFIVRPFTGAETASAEDTLVIGPGTTWTIQRTLDAGVYRIACALGDHAKLGMVNALAAQKNSQRSAPLKIDYLVSVLAVIVGSVYIIGDSIGFRLI